MHPISTLPAPGDLARLKKLIWKKIIPLYDMNMNNELDFKDFKNNQVL